MLFFHNFELQSTKILQQEKHRPFHKKSKKITLCHSFQGFLESKGERGLWGSCFWWWLWGESTVHSHSFSWENYQNCCISWHRHLTFSCQYCIDNKFLSSVLTLITRSISLPFTKIDIWVNKQFYKFFLWKLLKPGLTQHIKKG